MAHKHARHVGAWGTQLSRLMILQSIIYMTWNYDFLEEKLHGNEQIKEISLFKSIASGIEMVLKNENVRVARISERIWH